MARSLAAVVVVMLGLAWFVLHSMGPEVGTGDGPGGLSGERTPTLRSDVPPRAANPVGGSGAPEGRADPAAASGQPSEGDPQLALPPAPSVMPARPAPEDSAETARLTSAFERAQALIAAGDRPAAQRLLEQTRAEAGSPASRARSGLVLAGIVDQPAVARTLYSEAFREGVVTGAEFEEVGRRLRQLNADPGSSLLPNIEAGSYQVQSGDALWNLCHKVFPKSFGVRPEVGLVKLVNGMTGDTLQVGQRLVVPTQPLTLRVDSRELGLVAFLGDQVLAAYRVGLGKEGRTPRGVFTIEVKQENPVWWKDGQAIPFGDPENVLGTRWLGFEDRPGTSGYGIHGTAEPETIGLFRSMGCVRMRNEEVQELFEFVPRGTAVEIL